MCAEDKPDPQEAWSTMIVDRYDAVDLCELIPELRLEMEPELRELDRLLTDDTLFAAW